MDRALLALAATGVLIPAVALPVARERSSTRTHVRVLPAAPPPPRCTAGVAGCEILPLPAGVLAAVRKHFPGATVLGSYQLRTATAVYARGVDLRTSTGVIVTANSGCAATATPVRSFGRIEGEGPLLAALVVGGPDGCSVAVSVDVPTGLSSPAPAARALAADGTFRVRAPR